MDFDSQFDQPEEHEEKNVEPNLDGNLESDVGTDVERNVERTVDRNSTTENGINNEQAEIGPENFVDTEEEIDTQSVEKKQEDYQNFDFRVPAVYNRDRRDSFDELFSKSKHKFTQIKISRI